MSLLALLAARTPPVTPEPEPEVSLAWPPASPEVMAMRPAGRQILPPVLAAGSEAIAAAIVETKNEAARLLGPSNQGRVGPDYRRDIIIPSGEHTSGGAVAWGAMVSETGDPDDCTLWSDVKGAGGTIHTWDSGYYEGITFENRPGADGTGPKYPIHLSAGNDASQVFVNCRFTAKASLVGGISQWAGMDCGNNNYLLFYGCQWSGLASNLHGWAANTRPSHIVFVGCVGESGAQYDSLNGAPDHVWVVDSTIPEVIVKGAGVTLHIADDFPGTVTLANGATRTSADLDQWPRAVAAIGSTQQTWWEPSRVDEADWSQGPDADTTMAVQTGQVFYVPVPITTGMHATHAGSTASGVAVDHDSFQAFGFKTPTGTWVSPSSPSDRKSYYPRSVYPGDGVFYVRVRVTTATSLPASTTIAGEHPCYVETQGTDSASYTPALARVPAGTPHPVAYIRSAVAG